MKIITLISAVTLLFAQWVYTQDLPYTLVSEQYISAISKTSVATEEIENLFSQVHNEDLRLNSQTEFATADGRFHFFLYSYSWVDNGDNSGKLVLEVYDTKTGNLTELYKTDKDISTLIDPKGKFLAFKSYDTLRVVDINTLDLLYQLNNFNSLSVKISPSGKHMLVDYVDFMSRHAILVIETEKWQLLTKINFFAFGWQFIPGTNKFYINSFLREISNNTVYDRYKFSSVWDLDKIEELASSGHLPIEYSTEEVSFIEKFTDVSRSVQISPGGLYMLAGNSLFSTDGSFICQMPTPETLGNSVSWQISNDDLYLKTYETKWRVTSTEMINDTIKIFEQSLPDLKMIEGSPKGTYIAGNEYNLALIAKSNPDLAKIIYPGNNYTPYNTYGLKYSPTTKTIVAIEQNPSKGKLPTYKVGYFTGAKDAFKDICSFDSEKADVFYYFNKTNDKVIIRVEDKKSETAEIQLWDLVTKSMVKKIQNIEYYKYFIYNKGDYQITYFANEDLSKLYTFPNSDLGSQTGDTLTEIDLNTGIKRKIILNSPTICLGGIKDIVFDNNLAWIITENEAANSVAKYDLITGKLLITYQLPNALKLLEQNAEGEKIRDNAWKAKEEAERVLEANKFDAKAYKAKLKQEQKEVNSLVNQAVYEAATKNPVYESCDYCNGTGQIHSFDIKYTREVSGSWGYSSNYSNVTTTTSSYTKCSSCSGTGKVVCNKPGCYGINTAEIIMKVKNN